MPSIIDQLLITLGIDASAFNKGQKEAAAALAKTGEAAEKVAKNIESTSKRAADSIGGITEAALAMFAVFAGASSLKSFVADLTAADSSLGRLARNLGMAPETLSAWGNAVERNGGSASAAAASYQALSDSLQQLRATGQSGILDPIFRLQAAAGQAGGSTPINLQGTAEEVLRGIQANIATLSAKNPALANWYGRQIGLDPDSVNLMMQSAKSFNAALAEAAKNAVTGPQAAAAQSLVRNLAALNQSAREVGRTILADLAPYLNSAMVSMKAWVEANKAWIETGITDAIKDFAAFMGKIDWAAVKTGLNDFKDAVGGIVTALGGWKTTTEILFGLWTASKLAPILGSIAALRLALTGGAGSVVFGNLALPVWMTALLGLGVSSIETGLKSRFDAVFDSRRGAPPPDVQEHRSEGIWARTKRLFRNMFAAKVSGTGGKLSTSDVAEYVKQSALAHGVNPVLALAVARAEGLNSYTGDGGSSFGPFQLHYGGINPAMPHAGLGDAFTRDTGLDARDPSTVRQQIDYALQKVREGGWAPWSGARNQGITGFQGVGPLPSSSSAAPSGWAGTLDAARKALQPIPNAAGSLSQAVPGPVYYGGASSTSTSSNEVHVGSIIVHSSATDAKGLVTDIEPALQRSAFGTMANYGQA